MNWYKDAQEVPEWPPFPLREWSGEKVHDRDTPPELSDSGGYVIFHGTSLNRARKILQERTVTHDDLGHVGFSTTSSEAAVYGCMKAMAEKDKSAVIRMELDPEWFMKQSVSRETGGSGRNQFLINPSYSSKERAKIPPEAIRDIRIVRMGGDDCNELA
tara:strand:+ start:1624 stop:2100 length:477 start_codon:yes stop_codon:yes gene_type:complete